MATTIGGSAVASTTVSPRAAIAQAKRDWRNELFASAKTGDRATRFPSPSRHVLLQRLHRAEGRYHFNIVSVTMLRPLQLAPVIVIRSGDKRRIAGATAAIINAFDPRRVTRQNPSGFAYEGYFLEARDLGGMPYLATFNHWRAPHVGGGEWAANEELYPFPHG
ncbi:MAG: hypothetical protein H0W90_15950 [Actinobacteria bacterium]|nr:hypothetical protein [Actinomycetota bacterium]